MKKVIIFGCGNFTKKNWDRISKCFKVEALSDNNSELWGKKIFNLPCISPDMITDELVLVSVESNQLVQDILLQLHTKGVAAKHIIEALCEENTQVCIESIRERWGKRYVLACNDSQPIIYLLGAPAHSNMGDQAQTYCIQKLIEKLYPDYTLHIYEEYLLSDNYYELLYIIRQCIKREDMIFLHSGYHFTDLFNARLEWFHEKVVTLFSDRRLLFFPQTIHYKSIKMQNQSAKVFSRHNDIVIMCRDKVSHKIAQKYYTNCRTICFPDVVTSLIGRREYSYERKEILLCLRKKNTEESNITPEERQFLKSELSRVEEIVCTDTDLPVPWEDICLDREKYIEEELAKYARYKLVVTDRYHGMIFSLIANTPVIIMPSTDHKLISGMEWFPKKQYPNIWLCESVNEVIEKAREVVGLQIEGTNSDYLYQEYFKNLSRLEL